MKHAALALSGTLRTRSDNTLLSRTAQQSSSGLDFETPGGQCNIPLHYVDLGDIRRLWSAMAGGVLIATPEIAYTAPGTPTNPLNRTSTDCIEADGLPRWCNPAPIMEGATADPLRDPIATHRTCIERPRGRS